jgi:hypothetical protein
MNRAARRSKHKPAKLPAISSPVHRAMAKAESTAAIANFHSTCTGVSIRILMAQDGEDCAELLGDIAYIVGTGCQAGAAHVGREPWVRTLHGTLRQIIDLCLSGYQWRTDYAMGLQRSIEIVTEHLPGMPAQAWYEGMLDARMLARAIEDRNIDGNEVAQ